MAEITKASEITSAALKKNRPTGSRLATGDATLGRIIRDARKKKGWTQTQLAAAVGKTTSAISQYESGSIDIELDIRAKLAIELEIPQEQFFQAPPSMVLISPDEALLLSRFRKVPHELRQAVLLILGSDRTGQAKPD
jgi:transcriptional regulator with XRE-family HTH domain